MDNLPAIAKLNGIPPLLTKSLPPQELDRHRANVCVAMEMLVRKYDKFGWDQMNAGMRQMIREDWLFALADYPVDEVRTAGRQHTLEMPNKVPNEGHIKAIILRNRSSKFQSRPKPNEPERTAPRCSPEAHAEIMAKAGIKVKRMPKPQSAEQARENINAAKADLDERAVSQ